MNDKEKIKKALEEIEKLINFEEDMLFSRLHVMEEIKKVFVDKHIPLGNMDELTKNEENLHIAHHKWVGLIKKLLEE